MSGRRMIGGLALVAALTGGACASQTPTFAEPIAEPGIADPPPPRDTTAFVVPGAPGM